MPTEVPPPMASRSVEAQKFNSWVIGGGYSKTQMKRNQIKTDLAYKRKFDAEHMTSDAVERRKAELKQNQPQEVATYKPKVAEAQREERKARVAEMRRSSPERRTSPRRSPTRPSTVERPDEGGEAARHLRDRLLESFENATQSYGTLFPPLLAPYSRPTNATRNRDRPSSPRGDGAFNVPDAAATLNADDRPKEPFGLPGGDRRRPQPASGPKPFLPTGSTTTAYRHFTNYGQMLRMTAAQNDPFGDALSATAVQK